MYLSGSIAFTYHTSLRSWRPKVERDEGIIVITLPFGRLQIQVVGVTIREDEIAEAGL